MPRRKMPPRSKKTGRFLRKKSRPRKKKKAAGFIMALALLCLSLMSCTPQARTRAMKFSACVAECAANSGVLEEIAAALEESPASRPAKKGQ